MSIGKLVPVNEGGGVSKHRICLTAILLVAAHSAWCRKGNEPVYQDPFDLAAGGASLTRASQDAVMFSNPALMPWGKVIYRYSGFMPMVYGTPSVQDSVTTMQEAEEGQLVSTLFETQPLHVGAGGIASMVFKNAAFGFYQGAFFDIEAKKHGSAAGGPSIDFMAGSYTVGALSFAGAPTSWFSLGLTPKYVIKSEPDISIPITNQEAIAELQDPATLTSVYGPASGFGFDLGMLFFAQGKSVDYNLAIKVDDIGDTTFSCVSGNDCDQSSTSFKQVLSLGQSIVFHGNVHAISLAADYRDILDSYEEKPFKKLKLGIKILFQQHLGFALGLYHGVPSYGVRVDLWLLKFGLTRYSMEMTNVIGEKKRDIAMAYFSLGW